MSYVVYRVSDTYALRTKYGSIKRFATEAAAKGARTRYLKKAYKDNPDGLGVDDWAIAEVVDFRDNIEHWVESENLLSGKKFRERRNTPYYCSPSSETYWSS